MKVWTETVTHREGEWFPFDPTFDWNDPGLYPNNPEIRERKWKEFEEAVRLFAEGKKLKAWYDADYSAEVIIIGMYDGWPYWKPYPTVLLHHWLGPETHSWYNIRRFEVIPEPAPDTHLEQDYDDRVSGGNDD